MGSYATYIDGYLPTFRDNLLELLHPSICNRKV